MNSLPNSADPRFQEVHIIPDGLRNDIPVFHRRFPSVENALDTLAQERPGEVSVTLLSVDGTIPLLIRGEIAERGEIKKLNTWYLD